MQPPKSLPKLISFLHKPLYRVLLSALLTVILFLFLWNKISDHLVLVTLLWDVFAFAFVGASWLVFVTHSIHHIKTEARTEDGSRVFVLASILISSFAGMLSVLMLMLSNVADKMAALYYIPILLSAILLSWSLVHTVFTFHYANMFYDGDKTDHTKHNGGLDFPNESHPDYIDFAYFSFVIGMTFQVSDVEISSRQIRRTALFHSLLSFCLNTFVVALTINIIAGLKK
ncbi:DUF1345 domain-containing protein [Solitalea longa]|uniref:DUF1345 domain-containing protein n=1 Tax=Solitalea longa TaxID=2079460 RepID=A0A2S5A255_9SPHI|nr:DUF1345 domain-containing protein [Solitalea longa]POY36656.1 DUF1345 domain-containing protein [Solitalea longa]